MTTCSSSGRSNRGQTIEVARIVARKRTTMRSRVSYQLAPPAVSGLDTAGPLTCASADLAWQSMIRSQPGGQGGQTGQSTGSDTGPGAHGYYRHGSQWLEQETDTEMEEEEARFVGTGSVGFRKDGAGAAAQQEEEASTSEEEEEGGGAEGDSINTNVPMLPRARRDWRYETAVAETKQVMCWYTICLYFHAGVCEGPFGSIEALGRVPCYCVGGLYYAFVASLVRCPCCPCCPSTHYFLHPSISHTSPSHPRSVHSIEAHSHALLRPSLAADLCGRTEGGRSRRWH